jgi:hypothetical protein
MNLNAWAVATFAGALIGATQSTNLEPTTAADGAGIGEDLITVTMGA